MTEYQVRLVLSDIDRFRLLVWELRQLASHMDQDGCPHADHLVNITERFMASVFEDSPSAD